MFGVTRFIQMREDWNLVVNTGLDRSEMSVLIRIPAGCECKQYCSKRHRGFQRIQL